ncbi:MAG: hypothetical protein J6Q13_03125, partial [Clostridia bacterium]|nr:hypothetical protein [Clostridia bacterium]
MKKFSALLICLLMIITCSLAGCATFSINKVKYYNEVLATVGEKNITRFDLLSAYNSYGNSYYVQQMGQSEEQALNSTLDLLIDREALYQYALSEGDRYKPTEYQVNKIVGEIFSSMDEQMNTYVENAKKILNIKDEEETESEESSSETPYKLEDYTYSPRAAVKSRTNGDAVEYYIEYIVKPEEENYHKYINAEYLKDFNKKNTINMIKTSYFNRLELELETNEGENASILLNKAKSLMAKDLISYEYYLRDANGKEYSKETEDLLYRYFKRTFESQIQSQYLENIRVEYLKSEELSIELLTEEYSYLARMNYNTYVNDHDAYKNKMKNIGTDGDSVLYHPTTDTQFGYFIHTLISFDSIKENLSLIEELKEMNPTEHETAYAQAISKIKVKARDLETGLVSEDAEEVSINDVIDEFNSIKTDYSTNEERMSAFIQFMFKYTSDTATLSQGMPYVVGTNGYSAMVEEFNNEAISLMEGEPGNMSNADISNIDSLCITEYGIHLLYYVGDVNSFDIPYSSSNNVYIQNENKEG